MLREGVGVVPGNAKMVGVARDNNRDSELLASSCSHFDAVRPNDTATSIVAVDDCARTFAAAAAADEEWDAATVDSAAFDFTTVEVEPVHTMRCHAS